MKIKILSIILFILIIAVTGFAVWFLYQYPVLLTIFFTGIGYLIKYYLDKIKEIENKIFEKKEEAYKKLLKMFKTALSPKNRDKPNREYSINELNEMFETGFDSLTLASDEVIKEYVRFRTSSLRGEDPKFVLIRTANIILAIRKDLGYKNTRLNQIDVLMMFVNLTAQEISDLSNLLNIKFKY